MITRRFNGKSYAAKVEENMKKDKLNNEKNRAETSCPHERMVSPDMVLSEELTKIIEAGDNLAEAAHFVQSNYDGVHRLRLALSNWYKIRACEFGRG